MWRSGAILASFLSAAPALAADATAQQQIVDKAQLTLEAFATDGQLKDAFKQLSKEARALFIVPQFMRGAFIFGGAGGSGVLIARDERTGKWGDPVFYNIGSASFGAQIGADAEALDFLEADRLGVELHRLFHIADHDAQVDRAAGERVSRRLCGKGQTARQCGNRGGKSTPFRLNCKHGWSPLLSQASPTR